jgi:hypothetical protein
MELFKITPGLTLIIPDDFPRLPDPVIVTAGVKLLIKFGPSESWILIVAYPPLVTTSRPTIGIGVTTGVAGLVLLTVIRLLRVIPLTRVTVPLILCRTFNW